MFLLKSQSSYARKGRKRYYGFTRPQVFPPLAPEASVDYSVMPGGAELRAQIVANGGEAALEKASPKGPIRVRGNLELFFNGEVVKRRSEADKFVTSFALKSMDDEGMFVSEYIDNLGLREQDIVDPSKTPENLILPDLFRGGYYAIAPGEVEIDGAPCIHLVSAKYGSLWLDPALAFAVRAWDGLDVEAGTLAWRRINRDFTEVAPGLWLPRTAILERCGPPRSPSAFRGKPIIRTTLKVNHLSINDVPDDFFDMKAPTGTVVVDYSTSSRPLSQGGGGFISYQTPANPGDMDKVVEEAVRIRNRRETSRIWWYSLLIGTMVLGAALVIMNVLRTRSPRFGDKPAP